MASSAALGSLEVWGLDSGGGGDGGGRVGVGSEEGRRGFRGKVVARPGFACGGGKTRGKDGAR